MEVVDHAATDMPAVETDRRGRSKAVFGPPDPQAASRLPRLLISWKLWALALNLSIAAIGVSLSLRGYQRYQALKYLDDQGCEYELTAGSEWITDYFGDRAKGLRGVDSIYLEVVSDESFARVAEFPELRRLSYNHLPEIIDLPWQSVVFDSVSERGFQSLSTLTRLEEVQFEHGGLSREQLARWLETGPPLRSVRLYAMSPTRRTMEALSKIPTLTKLSMGYLSEASNDVFRDLAPMPNLHVLVISDVEIHRARWISGATHLRELELSSTTITPEIMQCIARLKELETLSLLLCDGLDNEALQHLIESPQLKTLAITTKTITWETLETLRRFPSLERIVFEGGQKGGWIYNRELREALHHEAVERGWELDYDGSF